MVNFQFDPRGYDFSHTVCFTGHRPDKLGGYFAPNPMTAATETALLWKIWAAYNAGYRVFISGMAQGTDQIAARLVIRLKYKFPDSSVKLVAAVPFIEQPKMWPAEAQQHYFNLLDRADLVEYVCGPGYSAHKMQIRNEWMVDRSNTVIAVWDGSSGGTRNCVDYALNKEREIWRINPKELNYGPVES